MNEPIHPGLLPAGLADLLPHEAAFEAAVVAQLMARLAQSGYDRVKPPLFEFEDSLLAGAGAALASDTFRLMDPISQRMIGLRADMTPQVARIAATRLVRQPRPLRLSYAGQVLRVRGSQLRPERQLGQVGAELIGVASAAADAEVIALAAEAVEGLGIDGLSIDLTTPTLVPAVCRELGLDGVAEARVRAAIDRKDAAALERAGGAGRHILGGLLAASGPADRALETLAAMTLPAIAAREVATLAEVVALVRATLPAVTLTVDPVENRGFEYHTGISFTLFARGIRGELGRGGRYEIGFGRDETATGFTLYTDALQLAAPRPAPDRRVFLPAGTQPAAARALRAAGWVTLQALDDAEPQAEAHRLGCTHRLSPAGEPVEI
ncbi:ATP phosphoribosyltransferase regulatory subunit [Allostella humosa]|uniref:ATP phosphoribosyltransferase regulatory subunit n=1 Tax=Stella humosa TaxID=94 RepID=UPI001139B488|nr:ATP phosphoribosyltransferase regulatory subunit [Stella humosa]BBK31013.1 ATP phosphoribosyltransferase regulatory subunit [Stella humosa]